MSPPGLEPLVVQTGEGDAGAALGFDGRALRVRLPRACAPGQRVELRVGAEAVVVRGKVVRVFRGEDGQFEVTLTLLSLGRAERLALEERLGARSDDGS